jgi:hypothetical protein
MDQKLPKLRGAGWMGLAGGVLWAPAFGVTA